MGKDEDVVEDDMGKIRGGQVMDMAMAMAAVLSESLSSSLLLLLLWL